MLPQFSERQMHSFRWVLTIAWLLVIASLFYDRKVLEELGIENPELLDPDRQRTLENQIRLNGYRKSLERLMLLQQQQPNDENVEQLLQKNSSEIGALRQQYSITSTEQEWILSGFSPEAGDK